MDKNELIQKLKSQIPGAVLKQGAFGRGKQISVWVEMKQIREVCTYLSKSFDWLENLSVMEIEGALVITYFLKSWKSAEFLVLRGSVVPRSDTALASVASVSDIWPAAALWESEAGVLFGIKFTGHPQGDRMGGLLPEGWEGYPLRKSYEFPKAVGEVSHSRAEEVKP